MSIQTSLSIIATSGSTKDFEYVTQVIDTGFAEHVCQKFSIADGVTGINFLAGSTIALCNLIFITTETAGLEIKYQTSGGTTSQPIVTSANKPILIYTEDILWVTATNTTGSAIAGRFLAAGN